MKGQWDRFVGPGATNEEEWIQLLLGGCIAMACIELFWVNAPDWASWYHYVVVVLLGMDIGGGMDLSRFRAAPIAHLCSLCFEGQGAFPAEG